MGKIIGHIHQRYEKSQGCQKHCLVTVFSHIVSSLEYFPFLFPKT